MTMNNELLSQALSYLDFGFSVIPVGRDKKPLIPWKEFQTRRPSVAEVREWLSKDNIESIAIVTGSISGVVVVDVEKGGVIDDLPKTVMSQTGGGGWHFYYKYDTQRPVKNYGRIRDLTDIRGDGGYVIAPPSLHKSGKHYEWITPMTRDALGEFPCWVIDQHSISSSGSSLCSETIDAKVNQGARNETATKMAGKIIRELDKKLWDTVGWSGFQSWNSETCNPPLDDGELRTIWDSIKGKESQKHNTKSKDKKDERQAHEIYWHRPRDGRIIEAYYDPIEEETGLLLFEDGKATKIPQVTIDGIVYVAPPPTNNLIKPGFVKLPSEALDFDSEISLLQEVKSFIHDYVQIPAGFEDMAAFYTLFSWVYDHFQELPYLRAIGDYGSGKSRFLKVMGALCYRPIFLNGSASASAIFRMIHQVKGSIILDEADFRLSDTSNEIVKILNSGFQKGIPVFRSEATGKNNKSYDPTPFDVFCPKVIATRKDFMDDALESRCLSNPMETLTRDDIPENLDDDFESRALRIRNKLVMFRFKKLSGGISKDTLPKLNVEPRLRQIISPLYRIIDDTAGKDIILKYIGNKQRDEFELRYGSFECELLQSIINTLETDSEPTMKKIAEDYNEKFAGKFPVKAKKVGSVVEQTFHLKKRKSAQGIYLCSNQDNEERIAKLKIKFGISETEVNIVNDVNVSEERDQIEVCKEVFGVKDEDISDI